MYMFVPLYISIYAQIVFVLMGLLNFDIKCYISIYNTQINSCFNAFLTFLYQCLTVLLFYMNSPTYFSGRQRSSPEP